MVSVGVGCGQGEKDYSDIPIHSDPFLSVLIHSNPFPSILTHSDPFRFIPIYSHPFRFIPIYSHAFPSRDTPVPVDWAPVRLGTIYLLSPSRSSSTHSFEGTQVLKSVYLGYVLDPHGLLFKDTFGPSYAIIGRYP